MYLLFDIGGTKMRVASVRDDSTFGETQLPHLTPWADLKIIDTPVLYSDGLEAFKSLAHELLGPEEPTSIVGGIAGAYSKESGMLVGTLKLTDWIGKGLEGDLKSHFGVPVRIENDAAMGGLGESRYGAGRGYGIFAYITVSTGIGGVRIVKGAIDRSSSGFEPGKEILDPDGTLVPNSIGHTFEDIVSGTGVEARTGKHPKDISDPAFWEEEAKLLALGLNNIAVFWSPEAIILGGSMILGDPGIPLESAERHLKEYLKIFPTAPIIKKAQLGDACGLWGALAYLKSTQSI